MKRKASCSTWGLYRDNGKLNGNYCIVYWGMNLVMVVGVALWEA